MKVDVEMMERVSEILAPIVTSAHAVGLRTVFRDTEMTLEVSKIWLCTAQQF